MALFRRNRQHSARLIVVLLSDIHVGHKLGLLNPATELMDEVGQSYSPGLGDTQRYLWDLYQGHIEAVADLADGCPVIVIHNGDVTQGDRYPSHLSMVLIHDQIIAATWALRPWLEHKRIRLKAMRIVTGTAVHTWEGASEVLVARQLAQMYPKVDIEPTYHALITLTEQKGQSVDAAHHGPFPGSRKWLKGSVAMRYLTDAMMSELLDGQTPPRVYVRSHYHEYLNVGPARVRCKGADVESSLIITPCYTGCDDHVRKVVRSPRKLDHGLVALEFEGGLREIHPMFTEMGIRSREEL